MAAAGKWKVQTPQTGAPGVGEAVWVGYAPTFSSPTWAEPGTGAAEWDGFAPDVTDASTAEAFAGVGAGAWDGYAPTVDIPLVRNRARHSDDFPTHGLPPVCRHDRGLSD